MLLRLTHAHGHPRLECWPRGAGTIAAPVVERRGAGSDSSASSEAASESDPDRCREAFSRAERCDIDHVLPWADGGPTNRANLMCLCRRHHVLKTHGNWQPLRTQSDGTVVWRGPDGKEYLGRASLPAEPEDTPPGEADGAVVVDKAVAGETTGADPPF